MINGRNQPLEADAMQSHYTKLLRATLTASLMLATMAGAAVAGPIEDADAAFLKRDYVTALQLYRPLADQGNAGAQDSVGAIYNLALGVPQDYTEAARWFRLAADQGHALAQYDLGIMYAEGHGVSQDDVRAHMWLGLSAAQGLQYAVQLQNRIAKKMTPAQIAEAQKLAREWKPKR